jgi:hypothetical protein
MLYAHVCSSMQVNNETVVCDAMYCNVNRHVCFRMLTYADVCWRMLTYAVLQCNLVRTSFLYYVLFHVCVYVYVCVCVHICDPIYLYVYIHVYIHTFLYANVCWRMLSVSTVRRDSTWTQRKMTHKFNASLRCSRWNTQEYMYICEYTCVYILCIVYNICI